MASRLFPFAAACGVALLVAACGDSTDLVLKPYSVDSSSASTSKLVVHVDNPPNTARPEFGAFVVNGEAGEFDAQNDGANVYHTFAMARSDSTLFLGLHNAGDFWMYSADAAVPTTPVLLEAFGDPAHDDVGAFAATGTTCIAS